MYCGRICLGKGIVRSRIESNRVPTGQVGYCLLYQCVMQMTSKRWSYLQAMNYVIISCSTENTVEGFSLCSRSLGSPSAPSLARCPSILSGARLSVWLPWPMCLCTCVTVLVHSVGRSIVLPLLRSAFVCALIRSFVCAFFCSCVRLSFTDPVVQ